MCFTVGFKEVFSTCDFKEALIREVRNQVAIWDQSCRKKADIEEGWLQVTRMMRTKFEGLEGIRQKELIKNLKRNWKNLRTYYGKYLSGGVNFKYAQQMSFLEEPMRLSKLKNTAPSRNLLEAVDSDRYYDTDTEDDSYDEMEFQEPFTLLEYMSANRKVKSAAVPKVANKTVTSTSTATSSSSVQSKQKSIKSKNVSPQKRSKNSTLDGGTAPISRSANQKPSDSSKANKKLKPSSQSPGQSSTTTKPNKKPANNAEDMAFFKCLITPIQSLSEDEKLELRGEIIKKIQEIKRKRTEDYY